MVLQSRPQCRSAGALNNRDGGKGRSYQARCISILGGFEERSSLCFERHAQSPWNFTRVYTSATGKQHCVLIILAYSYTKSGIMIYLINMSIIVFPSQFWGHDHLFSACRRVISASLKQELLQMWMFGILTNALGRKRKCELAHEVGKDSKACLAASASLVSRVSCSMHFMNFNLNVMIFTEWKPDLTECRSEERPQQEF